MAVPEPVLLTGATGFVGRAILAELAARGIPVEAVSRHDRPDSAGVRWHRADLLDPEDRTRLIGLSRATRLIHAAWYVEHGAFWYDALNADWRAASLDLATLFLAGGGRRIVGIGTCAEYLTEPHGLAPWPEMRAIAPTTPYGMAKALLHSQMEELSREAGASLVWARLFHLYGPGEHPARFVPALLAALAEGRPAEVRAADLVRDFASTAHVARCIVALLKTDANGAFNIGSGAPRSLGALARIMAEAVGADAGLSLKHAPGPGDPPVMIPDLSRLFATTGLTPEDVDEGLSRFANDQVAAQTRAADAASRN
ncbi:NAD(P)-dependent oxidoreductase [Lutimaribacter sp. EGI FJ00015]|uniref:NAD(P)-dependent oxidoreductase n=1 Tax=Lutimaribacter degradans TaxID=2945989 RepID=A0ACC6A016_9RHOB|nr:NAD(P)-dependent oxidoreductase [Lutimaribacter sp. EGI FJ00013]MCM2563770.1 NAD(P)-dependent oxidoreductase [Lutimaribacter sp. EGI FJ00013]MCO0614956.1 NAD(P)-dependent oxidoreductase [Lutimaribacter sp. EGI FJ00015]MCO0637652.1 NAD(P)-dependent oxidoreductase [Lutimaribacter sp. EGI FJ00014]